MRYRSHLLAAGLGLSLLAFAPSAHALSGSDGTPGDPGLSITTSGDATAGSYTGSNGGDGTGGYLYSGTGGHGGGGAAVNGDNILVNFNGGAFTGGHGGNGGSGFTGGWGGDGGNGLDVLSPSGTTSVNGGTFTGSNGGDGVTGYVGGNGGKGGNAVYVGSSTALISGGVFQAGLGGSGATGGIGGGTNGHDGVDFYVNGGTLNLLGTFDKPIVASDGYGTVTGTFSYNFGTLENQTYTFFDAGGGSLQINGITEIKAVPEASSVILFALLLTGGIITLRRRSVQRVTIA